MKQSVFSREIPKETASNNTFVTTNSYRKIYQTHPAKAVCGSSQKLEVKRELIFQNIQHGYHIHKVVTSVIRWKCTYKDYEFSIQINGPKVTTSDRDPKTKPKLVPYPSADEGGDVHSRTFTITVTLCTIYIYVYRRKQTKHIIKSTFVFLNGSF